MAATVTLNVPAVVGVPLRVEVWGGVAASVSESPGGRAPAVTAKLTGRTPPAEEMLVL